jgi:DNA (cytosine-5)-methyltransferase 1
MKVARPALGVGRAPFKAYLIPEEASDVERRWRRVTLLNRDIKRSDRKRLDPKYTVVDLFCGCGGFSTGLEATGRFRVLLGVDISGPALETFRLNHGTPADPVKTIETDLAKLNPLELRSELRALGVLTGELDLLVGGPPCEGFSQNKAARSDPREVYDFLALESHATSKWESAGAARSARRTEARITRSFRKDQRNRLFRSMLRAAAVLRPKIVLMENVREILTYREGAIKTEIIKTLSMLGYNVSIKILNAADYGVPQLRRRAFILAVRRDVIDIATEDCFPHQTHIQRETVGRKKGLHGDSGHHVSVWEAIGDLPLPRTSSGPRSREVGLRSVAESQFRRYVRRSGSVSSHDERTLSASVLARIKFMKPGMRSHDLPARLRTRKFFYNAYGRLAWNLPANTITKSFVYLGSGKFGHPEQDRGLTIREAARLQSFTDDFEFCSASVKTLAMMVGGAVPPLLSKAFGITLADVLDVNAKKRRKTDSRAA